MDENEWIKEVIAIDLGLVSVEPVHRGLAVLFKVGLVRCAKTQIHAFPRHNGGSDVVKEADHLTPRKSKHRRHSLHPQLQRHDLRDLLQPLHHVLPRHRDYLVLRLAPSKRSLVY